MKRPLIGMNCDSFSDRIGMIDGLRSPYARAVERAGGVPVLIPPYENPESLETVLDRVDAILLTGGDDVRPERLGVSGPLPAINPMTPERDRADFALIEAVQRIKIPTLAICLGCQELNIARGGTLWLDLDTENPSPVTHHLTPGESAFHTVDVEPDSPLGKLWQGARDVRVNSRHHQAIRAAGSGVRPLGHSPDGVVEAIELDDHPFLVGVQWHPENLACEGDPFAEKLFEALVAHAINYRKNVPRR
ncbi:MAG: gamma-glutamyl-gamma-aminobutyrate hydrolase family protein [Candidatus Sumerlaeia bacterium]